MHSFYNLEQERIDSGMKNIAEEETSKTTETKKAEKIASKTKENILSKIFNLKYFIKKYGLRRTSHVIFIIFWILLFAHISFGYTISTKRLIILFSFIVSFILLAIIHRYLFIKIINSDEDKLYNKSLQIYYPYLIFFLFILFTIIIYNSMPYHLIEKRFKFIIPDDN